MTQTPPPRGAGSLEEEGNKGARQLRNIVVKEEVQQEENHALVPIGPKFNQREGRLTGGVTCSTVANAVE